MGKTGTQVAIEYIDKLLKDPIALKKFEDDFHFEMIANENRLICSVIDPNYRQATVGDMIAYGMDHDYYTKLEHEALDLFYQNHGNGD